jgi:hypothetical protein
VKKLTTRPLLLPALAAFLVFCQAGQAAITSFNITFEGLDNSVMTSWDYLAAASMLLMEQTATTPGLSRTKIDVDTIGQSTFHVRKTVLNDTDVSWAGYKFTIEGTKVTLAGSYGSDVFPIFQIDGNTLTFRGSSTLPPGQAAIFAFDVTVSNPEPSSILLLGCGAMLLKRSKPRK